MPVARWRSDQVTFAIDANLTNVFAGVLTFSVEVPGHTLLVMCDLVEATADRKRITLSGVHVQGASANEIGVVNLRMMGDRFCEDMNYDELIVYGGDRTTGASPGRAPGRLRFSRRR